MNKKYLNLFLFNNDQNVAVSGAADKYPIHVSGVTCLSCTKPDKTGEGRELMNAQNEKQALIGT